MTWFRGEKVVLTLCAQCRTETSKQTILDDMSKTDLHSGTFWGGSGEEVKHQIEVASNSKSRIGKTFQTYSARRTVQHSSVTKQHS